MSLAFAEYVRHCERRRTMDNAISQDRIHELTKARRSKFAVTLVAPQDKAPGRRNNGRHFSIIALLLGSV